MKLSVREDSWCRRFRETSARELQQYLTMFYVIAGVILLFSLLVFLYIWLFLLLYRAPKGTPYDNFVFHMSSPKSQSHFVKTLFTFGYLKTSFAMFCRAFYQNYVDTRSYAALGKAAVKASLVDLNGKSIYLEDFVEKHRKIPLIINIGSYS